MESIDLLSSSSSFSVPEISLGSNGHKMPSLGFGTAASPLPEPEATKCAVMEAIEVGYRHFDTASRYQTEQPLGEAISDSLSLGLVKSRDEFFITSKLWCSDAHQGLVIPAIQKSLQNLKLDYLDLFLIHWPVSSKPGKYKFPIDEEDFLPMDFKSVWSDMEECQRLGLTKSIGVSNFSCKKLEEILSVAKVLPAVNQVEMNPVWQQKKLKEFCEDHGIVLAAYSALGSRGAFWGSNKVMESEILKEIAHSKGKTVAQVALRWAYEEGVCVLAKSFNKDRMKENMGIFDWSLSDDDKKKISFIPQTRVVRGEPYTSKKGPIKTVEEMWDGEI